MAILICQQWEESERGWGVKPDGYSLHEDKNAAIGFIDKYWRDMPATTPDVYSRPVGALYACEVSEDLYQQVCEVGSIRVYSEDLPESIT